MPATVQAKKANPPAPRLCISIGEAAERLGISRTHAFTMARTGDLPTIRLGDRILVSLVALNKMLEEGTPPARRPRRRAAAR